MSSCLKSNPEKDLNKKRKGYALSRLGLGLWLCPWLLTRSKLEDRREYIQKYLNANNIPSEDYCLYMCLTRGTKQAELSDKFLSDMEKLNKKGGV